ncbi:putative CDK4/6 [Lentinus tigrinus ALCF2SS1-7]|uniref:non-specific serine/threonine protein kinase n=1 Tax=Lentinus tigrinus ALCF2SS1-6 TaxID=1328759 RepID=A0A5C2RWB7_9APHY|nr:putative CDK4/6 [Lentinus tigrinus ALCF2SS1-6]RPD70695.1 putative CDK4/6 [Lentinus tigrinus ALCF2SS1-7]
MRKLRVLTNSKLRSPSPPRPPSTANFSLIESSQLIEEESLPWYDPRDFYPVRIGDVFQSRYQVIGKLGYGGYSTVWLCRDLMEHSYVTVKVCSQETSPVKREIAAYEYLRDLPKTKHYGRQYIRTSLDQFELPATNGSSLCLVLKPMAESVWSYRQGRRLPELMFKNVLHHVLNALDYLHRHAKLIHAEIQEKNILLSLPSDTASLEAYEERERTHPVPRKVVDNRIIYLSRHIEPESYGRPFLCDFGEARFGSTTYTGLIQPQPYRAPEVILGMPWNEKVDIWSVGVMIWNMFLGKNMFKVTGADEADDDPRYHIAHMVSLLGPPQVDFLKRSETGVAWQYFDAQGNWVSENGLPDDSLELSEDRLDGEKKAQFLRFVRKMVRWRPEDRATAQELMHDPWLLSRAPQ